MTKRRSEISQKSLDKLILFPLWWWTLQSPEEYDDFIRNRYCIHYLESSQKLLADNKISKDSNTDIPPLFSAAHSIFVTYKTQESLEIIHQRYGLDNKQVATCSSKTLSTLQELQRMIFSANSETKQTGRKSMKFSYLFFMCFCITLRFSCLNFTSDSTVVLPRSKS